MLDSQTPNHLEKCLKLVFFFCKILQIFSFYQRTAIVLSQTLFDWRRSLKLFRRTLTEPDYSFTALELSSGFKGFHLWRNISAFRRFKRPCTWFKFLGQTFHRFYLPNPNCTQPAQTDFGAKAIWEKSLTFKLNIQCSIFKLNLHCDLVRKASDTNDHPSLLTFEILSCL